MTKKKKIVKLFTSMIKTSLCALVINEQTIMQLSQKSFRFRFSRELEQLTITWEQICV